MEDNPKGTQPQGNKTSIEEWKTCRNQMTLACQFCTELGPAQPQLVYLLYLIGNLKLVPANIASDPGEIKLIINLPRQFTLVSN